MPIAALPPIAVQAIGSSQALTDAASVVKELIDNAIDGRATQISVEVSANTLDDIRVKDNGHGIAPNDRAMMCKRHCTSKIKDLHDLETIGGRSLGFRGEALASAAELSGSLTITTRIEGEGTAVELKVDRKGQISGEKRTSHPVGTSVKIGKYLQNLPVRRQAAEKMSVKTLAKVKRMLQAYALARPRLRLSLKILKAKDRKGDWTYPKNGASSASRLEATFNAATDIFGKKLTSQCDFLCSSWSSSGEQIDEATSVHLGPGAARDETYNLEATLAKQDCDSSVLSNMGQYLSVDSRPVSCTRGTFKQIVSSYKSHLRSAISSGDNPKIADPFLCLNVACPTGSYDANVEPAKDDVLFADSELLLGIVERWFYSIYGEIQPNSSKPSTKNVSAPKPQGIELLLARKEAPIKSTPIGLSPVAGSSLPAPQSASKVTTHEPRTSPLAASAFDSSSAAPYQHSREPSGAISHSPTKPPITDQTQTDASQGLLRNHDTSAPTSPRGTGPEVSHDAVINEGKPHWRGSMYAEDDDEEENCEVYLQGRPGSGMELDMEGDEQLRDVNVSNPWAFAKLNAKMRTSDRNKQLHTPRRQMGDVGHSTNPSSDDLPQHVNEAPLEKPLPRARPARSSPEAAYSTPDPFPFPQKARGKRKAYDATVDSLPTPAPSNKERYKRGALDTWVQKSLGRYEELDDTSETFQEDQGSPDLSLPRDFVSARSLPQGGATLSEIPDSSQRPRRKPAPRKQQEGNIDKPFVSPVNDPNRVWFDVGENSSRKRHQKSRPKIDHQATAAAPTLVLRDDEIDDDAPVISVSKARSLPPIHPDLAITLDYEARKQKAGEAHKKALREQATAAKLALKAQPDVISPHHPQHTTTSPHKNRQAKAIAALHTSDTPSPLTPSPVTEGPTAALEPSDPRSYLLRIHQQGNQAPESIKGKSKRHKTALLPFETVQEEIYTGDLTFMIEDVNAGNVEADMKESGAWDHYVKKGEVGEAFRDFGLKEFRRWEGQLRELVGRLYAGEGGERADVSVDLSKILQARAAGCA